LDIKKIIRIFAEQLKTNTNQLKFKTMQNAKNEKLALTTASKLEKATNGFVTKVESTIKAADAALKEINTAAEKGTADYVVLLENIDAAELKLKGLNEDFGKKKREAEYDLTMAVKENTDKVFLNILIEKKMEAVESGTVSGLNNKIEELEDQIENAKWRDEKKVTSEREAAVRAAVNNAEMTFKAESAQDKAKIESQSRELEFANKQIASLEAMIEAEREARVKEAEARGKSQVNITNTK
jgi:hypothetical protein